ncbi:hypothetical protein SAICODRAFT_4802 [Saitoella complicata NRRL Y-17804]|uniref:uncharacterized protein n=1 Tax=Saitoella complicata (strain BCRC 22490 / CBS 7301 / JCM 7358 / NBRC 10748 / NRRL Y-17804) TaxID=698492 RepID=UPI000867D967|nr:uncharacterized protein SAICODRAFT_4802 [Saitoella complicata NRRL Y-17804]ODQ55561.1 hypothetical protein SAICODRAFT_4802 [Saitoella complicata NRRL Y-17804]
MTDAISTDQPRDHLSQPRKRRPSKPPPDWVPPPEPLPEHLKYSPYFYALKDAGLPIERPLKSDTFAPLYFDLPIDIWHILEVEDYTLSFSDLAREIESRYPLLENGFELCCRLVSAIENQTSNVAKMTATFVLWWYYRNWPLEMNPFLAHFMGVWRAWMHDEESVMEEHVAIVGLVLEGRASILKRHSPFLFLQFEPIGEGAPNPIFSEIYPPLPMVPDHLIEALVLQNTIGNEKCTVDLGLNFEYGSEGDYYITKQRREWLEKLQKCLDEALESGEFEVDDSVKREDGDDDDEEYTDEEGDGRKKDKKKKRKKKRGGKKRWG